MLKDSPDDPEPGVRARLATRNLLRGYLLRMPTGQAVARALRDKLRGVREIPVLGPEEIEQAAASGEQVQALRDGGFLERTPLWYYVLADAASSGGERLGPVGREALDHAGLSPGDLLLEITENVLMEDAEHNKVTLEKLKESGVALAIDDFGTGYSSLAYLRRFSVDYLKIDRSFTHGLGSDSENKAIVLGMIGLAHAVGLKTVAEGVEYAEQLAQLRAMRCDMAQGYHFAKPMPCEGASEFLAKRFGDGDGTEPKHGSTHRA